MGQIGNETPGYPAPLTRRYADAGARMTLPHTPDQEPVCLMNCRMSDGGAFLSLCVDH